MSYLPCYIQEKLFIYQFNLYLQKTVTLKYFVTKPRALLALHVNTPESNLVAFSITRLLSFAM